MYDKLQLEREKMQAKMSCLQMARELTVNTNQDAKTIVKDAEILWGFVNSESSKK